MQYVPPKRQFTQDLHDVTSQITALFIVTAVKNLKTYTSKIAINTYKMKQGNLTRFKAARI
jgi:hypothetical protein